MCNFCNQRIKEPAILHSSLQITLDGTELKLDYDAFSVDSSFVEWIKIKFCPFCGEELRNHKPNDEGRKTTT